MYSAISRLSNLTSFINILIGNRYITLIIILCASLSCEQKSGISTTPNVQLIEQLANECFHEYPNVPWIQLKDFLYESKETKWIIVDVRSQRERDVSIIPDAISREEFESECDSFKNTPLLVYCTVGCRSGAYTKALNHKGFKAFNLRGGILAWALEGKKFVTHNGKTTYQAHVYARKWDALPSGYKAVW